MKPKNGLSCRDIRVSGKKKKRMGATPIFFSVDNIGKKKNEKICAHYGRLAQYLFFFIAESQKKVMQLIEIELSLYRLMFLPIYFFVKMGTLKKNHPYVRIMGAAYIGKFMLKFC